MGTVATGVKRLYATVVVTVVVLPLPLPRLDVTPVTVTVLAATPSVAATADANRRLKVAVWATVAVTFDNTPPEMDCVASSVVRTVVVGTPQAAATARLSLDLAGSAPHVPEINPTKPENSLAPLPVAQLVGDVKNLMFSADE